MTTLLGTARAEFTVFAAASTTELVRSLAAAYEKEYAEDVRLNFASSGALARQIEAGAPADLFISANTDWMKYLSERERVKSHSTFPIARNELVLIVPIGSTLSFDDFPDNFTGQLAIGNPKSVPAGVYAQEVLNSMNAVVDNQFTLIKANDVRTVLMYVERGEVEAGMVYATAALASKKVITIGKFSADSHGPSIYSAAACSENETALQFLKFMKSGKARSIIESHGFIDPEK